MKTIVSILLLTLSCFLVKAQADYSTVLITDSTYTLQWTETLPNDQINTTSDQGEYDSLGLVSRLLRLTEQSYRTQASNWINEYSAEREARDLRLLLESFSDTTYFSYTHKLYANRYTQAGVLPNFRLRIGSDFYWAKGFIVNGLLRLEITDNKGENQSPRDLAGLFCYSNKSLRLGPIAGTGEPVDLYYKNEDNQRKTFIGVLSDGERVVLTQLKLR